jgi:S1-C subfamily serine protease
MPEIPTNPLAALSDQLAGIVEHAARSVVAVHGGRSPMSGIHWRPGIIVTAEEALERDEDITVTLPDGRTVAATLAGRDPTTDVAVLRFPSDGLQAAETGDAGTLRAGNLVLAIGRSEAGPVAAMGVVAIAGNAWQSQRGGTIDRMIRLDLALARYSEGGALIDAAGRVVGMTVPGPRRRVLAIPASTIDRVTDLLLAKGRIPRGYLGAGLQTVTTGRRRAAAAEGSARGIIAIGIDPDGPASRAGMVVGDIITGWAGEPVDSVRDLLRRLGPDSVGQTVALQLLHGGAATTLEVIIGERPQR